MKYALIGCGRVSPCHMEAAKENNLEIAALCDLDKSKAEKLAEDYGIDPAIYTDYKKMIDELNPDLIAVATDHDKHKEIALYAIRSGVNVIIEKPIALSLKDADLLIEEAEKHNVKLTVCHQNRFNKSIQKIREAVEEGRFGKMFYGTTHARWNRSDDYYELADWRGTWAGEGGSLITQCIHSIDLLMWMLGDEATEVMAYTDRLKHEKSVLDDVGFAIVKFKNGSYGVVESTTNVYPENLEGNMYLFGEKGTVKSGGEANNKIEVWKFEDGKDDPQTVMEEYYEIPPNVYGFGHRRLYADMIDAVKNDRQPYIDGAAGKRALELIFAMYLSTKEHRPVTLPLGDVSSADFEGLFE